MGAWMCFSGSLVLTPFDGADQARSRKDEQIVKLRRAIRGHLDPKPVDERIAVLVESGHRPILHVDQFKQHFHWLTNAIIIY